MTTLNIMTGTQIARGLALRRYGFGKPVQQIADEAGLAYKDVLDALKGASMKLPMAARLTGYLRTPCSAASKWRDRFADRPLGAARIHLLRRVVAMRILARKLGMNLLGNSKTERRFGSFTNGELRAYCLNAEDAVKGELLKLYPWIAKHYKLSDGLALWEYLERIERLKASPEVRNAIANSHRAAAAESAR